MSNTIQIKRSSTAAAVPTAGQLAVGELAVNLADKKLFTKDASNAVFELGVALTGNQTIAGVKTFSSSPVVPNATTATQALAFGQVSTANAAPVKAALNASGGAPIYACRAWVNFNGTTTPPSILASGNVSSVSRSETGLYTVNFAAAMPDASYSAVSTGTQADTFGGRGSVITAFSYTTTSVRIAQCRGGDATPENGPLVSVSIFR